MTAGPSADQAETTLRRTEYEEQALRERNEVGLVFERRLRRESACERCEFIAVLQENDFYSIKVQLINGFISKLL